MNLIKAVEEQYRKKITSFRVGDTVRTFVKVVEGDKERLQPFEGVAAESFLREGLDQFCLGPAYLGRVDQSEYFACANSVTQVILDLPHRPRQP